MAGRTMMMVSGFTICAVIVGVVVGQLPNVDRVLGDEIFGYPVDEAISPQLQNARNRTPIFVPHKCAENEILYPGDHSNDWVCDCRPGHVYYPKENKCYSLFTKGFCQQGEYVDVMRPSLIVGCTKNSCAGRNMVPYNGQCVELYRHNKICPLVGRTYWVIGVNATTLQLECVQSLPNEVATLQNRHQDEDTAAASVEPILFEGANRCSNGTRTRYEGLCA